MKTLKISEDLHKKVKIYCATNGLKINEWVEKQIEKILEENDSDKKHRDKTKSV